jgi:hypothetical protein
MCQNDNERRTNEMVTGVRTPQFVAEPSAGITVGMHRLLGPRPDYGSKWLLDRLARQLLNMTTDPNVTDPVKLAAIKDALDRSGIQAKTAFSVEVLNLMNSFSMQSQRDRETKRPPRQSKTPTPQSNPATTTRFWASLTIPRPTTKSATIHRESNGNGSGIPPT